MRALAHWLTPALALATLAVGLAACATLLQGPTSPGRPADNPRGASPACAAHRALPPRSPPALRRGRRHSRTDRRTRQVAPPVGVVRVSSILRFYREDFLAKAPSLVAYANRYRTEPIPEDYAVRFIPYDWILHQR